MDGVDHGEQGEDHRRKEKKKGEPSEKEKKTTNELEGNDGSINGKQTVTEKANRIQKAGKKKKGYCLQKLPKVKTTQNPKPRPKKKR
jgi:hypothetical protein